VDFAENSNFSSKKEMFKWVPELIVIFALIIFIMKSTAVMSAR